MPGLRDPIARIDERMSTPFDEAISKIKEEGYHNHRRETHSDTVSKGVFNDLMQLCETLRKDVESGEVRVWYNVRAPGNRGRKIDLFVGEPAADGVRPDIRRVRIAMENKSVVTAHRNKTNRFDDLKKTLDAILQVRSEAVVVATVLVGLAERVLNIPDRVHPLFKGREAEFETKVLPRLSTGDRTLWEEFNYAVSTNRPTDPEKTVELFRKLRIRDPAHTHVAGYDYILLVPVFIDNVNPPYLARESDLRIDVDQDYEKMLEQICKAYTARWHL